MCMIFFYFPLFSFFMSSFFILFLCWDSIWLFFLLAGEQRSEHVAQARAWTLHLCSKSFGWWSELTCHPQASLNIIAWVLREEVMNWNIKSSTSARSGRWKFSNFSLHCALQSSDIKEGKTWSWWAISFSSGQPRAHARPRQYGAATENWERT